MIDGMKAEPISQAILMEDYYDALHHAYNSMRTVFRIRERNGLTQEEIADSLEVDKSLISRRIKGRENMTLKTLSGMATVLDCKLIIEFKPIEHIERKNIYSNFSESKSEDVSHLVKIKRLNARIDHDANARLRSATTRLSRDEMSSEHLDKKRQIAYLK